MSKIKCLIGILLIVSISLMLFGCSGRVKSDVIEIKGSGAKPSIETAAANKLFYVSGTDRNKLKKVAASDSCSIYFDETTYSVSVYDSIGRKYWDALPSSYSDGSPAVVSVDVAVGANVYTLNSQQNSVAKKSAKYEIKNGSLLVTYSFNETLSDGTRLSFDIPIKFSVESGTFTASVDCSKIRKSDMSDNAVVKNIRLLDYFGSNTASSNGDYIMIPDGCGAIIDLGKKSNDFKKITLPVYGADYSAGEKDSSALASVASYGMKSGDKAFVALIESGDAIAKISAEKALEKSAYNKVGASFELTKTMTDKEKNITYIGKMYDGEIKLSYRLLSGDNSDYIGMAGACREMLIRNGTLNFVKSADNSESMPLVLSLIGAAETGGEKPKLTRLTTFEQAIDILSVLRGKGIGNISLRYRGMLDGGLQQKDITKAKVSSQLGSSKQLKEFIDYTDAQNITLFTDVNMISAKNLSNKAASLASNEVTNEVTDLSGNFIKSNGTRDYLAVGSIEKATNYMLSQLRTTDYDGICISDAGKTLYSDFSNGASFSRQQMKETITPQIASISSSKKLMVNGGNIYAMKYAEMVVNVPTTAACSNRSECSSVPFLQTLLHGVVNYSCAPINFSSNMETAMLKAAEFGCVPSFEFYYEDYGTDNKADNCHYMNYATNVQLCYDRMNNVFADLSDRKITAHYRVKSGVYCTEYGAGTSIYVNYNKTDVTVSGVTIEARDFLRVN